MPIPYIEGRSNSGALDEDDDDDAAAAAALEDQRSRTLWTQAHNHDMIRGNPRGRNRAAEVLEANEKTWGAIHGGGGGAKQKSVVDP